MKEFLAQVAADIINKYGENLADIAIVFPNKRAALFMNEHFARISSKPLWAPSYITISDFFAQQSSLYLGDNIKLICELHKVFTLCTQKQETLDSFLGWGQLLLADFDDLDKNLADASKVFQNLANIKEYDDISYLTNEQKEIVKKFFNNFTDTHNSIIKERFISLWNKLGDIYTQFQKHITAQGITYEGHLYRSVIEKQNIVLSKKMYIFVGFNLLHKSEEKLFEYIMKEKKASFYWDFDHFYMNNKYQEAGYYIKKYLSVFPNELDNKSEFIYQNWNKQKDITYISSTTNNLQTRYITSWLLENNRIEAGKKTVIVLCDETLLPNVLHALPPQVDKVNITMGFPLQHAQVSLLIQKLLDLYQIGKVSGANRFKLSYVNKVLMHPYLKNISENTEELYFYLQKNHVYYPNFNDIFVNEQGNNIVDDNLKMVFSNPIITQDNAQINLLSKLIEILKHIGKHTDAKNDPLMQESIFRMYTLLNRLKQLIENKDLVVEIATLRSLINQLIKSTTIPFHGEPIEGIQIMGVLETRNLDFEHVLMLNCNEGNMPKSVNDSSFIPYNIRKAYELTTIEHKVHIFAYYFYRLLQRASNISITYSTGTQNGKSNELSRFMLQLLVEGNNPIKKLSLKTYQTRKALEKTDIIKTDCVMKELKKIEKLSPTAINKYIACPAKFYYSNVLGVKEPEENDEAMNDNRTFGKVFHKAMELIYQPFNGKPEEVTAQYLNSLIENEKQLEAYIDEAFVQEVFHTTKTGFVPQYNGLQEINKKVILKYIKQVLQNDAKNAPFCIKALEQRVGKMVSFYSNGINKTIKLEGIIDRLDQVGTNSANSYLRVIDYKTGKADKKIPKQVEDVFNSQKVYGTYNDYFFQTILYCSIIKNSSEHNPHKENVAPHLLFIQKSNKEDYNSELYFEGDKGKEGIVYIKEKTNLYSEFNHKLEELVSEIYNPNIPFSTAKDANVCKYCLYTMLCKREKKQ